MIDVLIISGKIINLEKRYENGCEISDWETTGS